jgi:hypothetical protein
VAWRAAPKTFHFQLEVIDAVAQAYAGSVPYPQSAVVKAKEVNESQVSAWLRPASQLKAIFMVAAGKGGSEWVGGRGAQFPDCDDQLYRELYDRRVYRGLRVSHRWLRRHMEKIL